MPSIYLDFVSLEAYGVEKAVLLDRLQGAILAALPDDLKLRLRSLLEAHGFVPEEEIVVVQQPEQNGCILHQDV